MSDKKFWRSKLTSSQEDLTENLETKNSKKNIYYSVMEETFPEGVNVSYSRAQELTEDMASSGFKEKSPNKAKILAGSLVATAAVAAALTITFFSLQNSSKDYLSPPLKLQDFPLALADDGTSYLTVSTNNDFFLGYAQPSTNQGTVDVLVHSRAADISWDTLSAVDQDDYKIKPIAVNSNKNVISLPIAETDIYFSICDENGNTIECIIPTAL